MAVALLLLAAAAAAALAQLFAAGQACARRELLTMLHGLRAGAVGRFGVSLLLTEEVTLRRIEELLRVEYTLYEVVAVIDGGQQEELLEALALRYRLIRLDYHPTGELPVRGIRAIYRSRTRCLRRLVVVDCAAAAAAGGRFPACDAAAEVAAYDYLLPLRADERLTTGAIERIVVGLASQRPAPAVLHARSGRRATLYSRAAVVAAGGFRRGLRRHAAPRLTIDDPLTVEADCRSRRCRWRRGVLAAAFAAALGAGIALAPEGWFAAAWSLTLLLLALCLRRIRQLHRSCE